MYLFPIEKFDVRFEFDFGFNVLLNIFVKFFPWIIFESFIFEVFEIEFNNSQHHFVLSNNLNLFNNFIAPHIRI